MITVQLLGGMGNQMFQYAFALALRARGYSVQLDKSRLPEGNPHPPIREYSLDAFGEMVFGKPEGPTVAERSLRYKAEHLSPKDPSVMLGYWQTEKYFNHIESDIREAFIFKKPLSDCALGLKSEIENSYSIAVHVRRTDFLKHLAFHGMPSLSYYDDAIQLILNHYPSVRVFVFSDDPTWCHTNFPSSFKIVEGMTKYEDLQLMSLCQHAVIANSSFSWWGAWLGDSRVDRLVVAPKQWFASTAVDSTDLVPERWLRA